MDQRVVMNLSGKLIAFLALAFISSLTYSEPCYETIMGPYQYQGAWDACLGAGEPGTTCWQFGPATKMAQHYGSPLIQKAYRVDQETGAVGNSFLGWRCDNVTRYEGFDHHSYYALYYLGGCPKGTTANEAGLCECDYGKMNYETMSCEPKCENPTIFNEDTGLCEKECPADKPWNDAARDCVAPPEPDDCSNQAGNPINFFSGHKLQREFVFALEGDFPLAFTWLYNSFGNHRKTGAGYSIGAGVSGDTVMHSEPLLPVGAAQTKLPLDKNIIFNKKKYTGNADSNWRHNHSYFLSHYTLVNDLMERAIVYRPNGHDIHFQKEGENFLAPANRNMQLSKLLDTDQEHVGWLLKSGKRIERYDIAGRILRLENERGQGITYTYENDDTRQETISDDYGNVVDLRYNGDKLQSIRSDDGSIYYQFAYNSDGLLYSINIPGTSPKRIFRYEDARFPYALTGVTDEAGKIYSTFAYDDQGRAIRTEHNGGAESVDVEYVNTNTRRLTNALGKSTTYTFSNVGNGKRITSVSGEASANCAAANKGYTYGTNGFVASETDWEGNVTTYTRDNLGRELTRTEAAGTPEARTIITEWHPEFNVPAKVTTPESVTDYSYDSSGRLLGQKVTPLASP